MKNAHPIVSARTSSPVGPDSTGLGEPIIRLKLQKPLHWEWELTTSADALPVIQLLDKNGRLLVETTGQTAQRARGSFREGLRTHEQFPVDESRASSKNKEQTSSPSTSSTTSSFVATAMQGNRNFDGFSNKFGTCNFAPRKSRSDVNIKEGRGKKKHFAVENATMKTKDERNIKEATTEFNIYSAGDYLRQQIMNDLHTRNTIGQTPEEIAKNRCRKVKAYLRSQSESLLSLVREEDCDWDEAKNAKIGSNGKNARSRSLKRNDTVSSEKKNLNEENRKVKSYLQTRTTIISPDNSVKESSKPNEENDRVVRKIKDDMNEEELTRIRAFLRDKIQRRMNMEQARSRSAVRTGASEIVENGIKKRYSNYSHEDNRKNYRTRKVRSETSILRFDPEVLERERLKSSKQLEKEKSNCRGSSEDSQLQRQSRNYRQSRSEVLVEALEPGDQAKSQLKRASSSLEKRKLYRKTKSDVLLGQAAAAAAAAAAMTTTTTGDAESTKVLFNPPRRIKSQENVERSWREYKERKRSERLRRESEREAPEEDDFMSKPRWKDLQRDLCFSRNCKICQNLRNCVDPFHERGENSHQKSELSTKNETAAKFPEEEIPSANSSRPGTSLQENYLLVVEGDADKSPVIAKIQARDRGNDVGGVSAVSINSPDFGYNSIPSKNAFKDYRELYAHSNVKKSDTFKIVDGSEDLEERANDSDSKINGGGGSDSDLGYLNGEGSLANKSNEDITRDYFKRVYELLKRRQEEVQKSTNGSHEFPGHDDSSSSNYVEEMQTKRQRRRKKDRSPQGEEVVTVPSTSSSQEAWKVQRLSVNNESPQSSNRRRGYSRPQLQPVVSGGKRNRPAPPLQLISCKVNAKNQVDRYFDWPNKENTPGNAVNRLEEDQQASQVQTTEEESTMGSNLSRHNGKGLTGRRTQSSGNLCDPKGKLNSMGKILVPCSSAQRERYKFCGSLPNHLDDKDVLDDDQGDNNNVMSDNIGGNFGTLPHKKRSLGVHFSDSGPTGTLDLVKHRSQDSLDENDPWRYQQSDLDLVRCRHGNFDSVKRNRSADTVLVDSGRRYGRGVSLEDRCHRNSDLDLVGTLPKRKPDARNSSGRSFQSNSSSSQPCIVNTTSANNNDDLLMKIVHKPDCELLKHRQQFGKCVDLKLSKLASGEPQDQGYASERSPEDEHPPSLPGQPFPNVTPESTFRVTLQKSSRGLGLSVSGGGTAGPVRVKRLFPQQPAALSNKLQIGDILLAANGTPLTGLTNYEALEVLRTTPSTVELVVCRLPGDSNVTPPGEPPPPPARREPPPPLRILNPLPPLQIEPCGEFDIEMTKVDGSLGFTLRKADSSALGHYVRALKREPALSDGRIKPGDKIVAVDGAPLSPMSHEEAVQLLRQCGPTVKLRLYRDLAQTPVSALSPTESDHPLRKPRSLRQEAVDMLCDLAVRKLSPGTSSGSSSCKQQSPGASCNSPRRLRRLATRTPTAETDQETSESKTLHDVQMTSSTVSQAETTSDSDQCSVRTQITNSQANTPGADIIDPPPLYVVCDDDDDESKLNNNAARPRFLDLSAPQGKPHFQFCSVDSDSEYPGDSDVILAEAERGRLAEPSYGEDRSVTMLSSDEHDNDLPSEPASMPLILSSTSSTSTAAFSYKNPAYQSANPACGGAASDPTGSKSKITHSSDQDIPGKILGTDDPGGSKGLLKWKGVMFAPNDEVDQETEHDQEKPGKDTTDSVAPIEDIEQGSEVFMVELTRGWNSRLGFSLQPEGNRTVISVVHPDSVAAKDGRLKQGDVLLMVNEDSVEHMSTADIIDLLRKIRGSIGITVMRRSKRDNVT